MAASRTLNVMISSRCTDQVRSGSGAAGRLTDVRQAIKDSLEHETLCDEQLFRVEITPEHPAAGADQTFWEASLKKVRQADIVLVLYNGDAGYPHPQGHLGICEAEFNEAIASGSQRTQVIILTTTSPPKDRTRKALNERFQDLMGRYVPSQAFAATAEDALTKAREAVLETTLLLVKRGTIQVKAGRADVGASLQWSQLSFQARKREMESELVQTLEANQGAEPVPAPPDVGPAVSIPIGGTRAIYVCHAIPAAFSVPAAREMIGRPFLLDHRLSETQGDAVGPIHLIACHKGVTEKQATDLLGFPDATVVKSGFGVYIADNVQKVQMVLLAHCHNPDHTRSALAQFHDWLQRSGQVSSFLAVAQARGRIVSAVAAEQIPTASLLVASSESAGSGGRSLAVRTRSKPLRGRR